ncbi:hypothetical protein V1358_04215 [Pseudoalteromonas sp. YIC-656]|uniref:hypothetical protein n=1 Tax=Pseudoalteromonas pernae TaxID=3118054 RepID=UPI0032425EE5
MKASQYAVISGDLVGSSRYESTQYESMLGTLEQGLSTLCERFDGQFDMFRGDAFQCIFKAQTFPLQSSLLLRLLLRSHGIDARISEAWGDVSQFRGDVKTATGPALILSGKGLDEMKQQRFRLSLCEQTLSPSFMLNVQFLDNIVSSLSQKQAQALYLYCWQEHNDHASIAQQLQSSRENVTKLLNAGRYHLVDGFIAVATKEFSHG